MIRSGRPSFVQRAFAVVVLAGLIMIVAGLASVPARAQGVGPASSIGRMATPEFIISRLMERNQNLQTYQAKVQVQFKLRSFPYIRQRLDGTAYFQRPSTYDVVFKKVPSYAKGFNHLSADLADASSWEKRFYVTLIGTQTVDGRKDIVMRLVQRVRGQIDHQDVFINPQRWEVDGMEYHYYNGGMITMQQHFETIGAYRLITAQDAQIRIPYVKAVAHAEYSNYHTNVSLGQTISEQTRGH